MGDKKLKKMVHLAQTQNLNDFLSSLSVVKGGNISMTFIGVDIGGTKCSVVLGDENGNIIKKVKFPTLDVNTTIEQIKSAINKFSGYKAVGISCGGPLDAEKGIIQSPPNLLGWDDIPIKKILRKNFNVPVFLQNDADACALAEWKFGAGRGCKNMVFLTFGTGLGAGLILNGELYRGSNGCAGEVGHIRLADYGPVGYGKAGSFEGFCSGGGIAQYAAAKALAIMQTGRKVSYCESSDDLSLITAKSVAEKAEHGFEDAISVYKECGKMLGRGLAILIDLLNPEKIVIGSIFTRTEKLLRYEMQKVIDEECLKVSAETCRIVPAALGESIGDVAAVAVAADKIIPLSD